MLSCKQIVSLASKNIDAELIWHEKLEFKIHLIMCKHCNHYAKQLKLIQQAVVNLGEQIQTDKSIRLSSVARRRIAGTLSKLKT